MKALCHIRPNERMAEIAKQWKAASVKRRNSYNLRRIAMGRRIFRGCQKIQGGTYFAHDGISVKIQVIERDCKIIISFSDDTFTNCFIGFII